jgi:hypothetical protein
MIISAILSLLSSGAVGSIVGLIGGYVNRKLDIESKAKDHEFDLAKMDKDLEFMKAEYEQKTKVATIEGEAAENVAGYNAMAASYSYAPVTGDSITDRFSKLIRPLLTLAFFFFTIFIFYQVSMLVDQIPLTQVEVAKVYIALIEWVLFQAGVSIGWWYAMRPGKMSQLLNK